MTSEAAAGETARALASENWPASSMKRTSTLLEALLARPQPAGAADHIHAVSVDRPRAPPLGLQRHGVRAGELALLTGLLADSHPSRPLTVVFGTGSR